MKKIRLNVANLKATEILSKEQLRSLFGGSGSASSLCDGKTTYLKCTDMYDNVIYQWQSTGCPSTNQCDGGYAMSCAC